MVKYYVRTGYLTNRDLVFEGDFEIVDSKEEAQILFDQFVQGGTELVEWGILNHYEPYDWDLEENPEEYSEYCERMLDDSDWIGQEYDESKLAQFQ